MNSSSGLETHKNPSLAVTVAVVLIAALLLAWGFVSSRKSSQGETPTHSAKEVSEAFRKVSAPSVVKVPTSANPVKRVLSEENPVEKANPFNKIYKNPFDE